MRTRPLAIGRGDLMQGHLEQVTLRSYRAQDSAVVREIDLEFQEESGLGAQGRPFRVLEDLDDIDGAYLQAGGHCWIAENRGRAVVGCGGVLRIDDGTARLRRFRVRRQWRRRGIATLLLLEAERFCREQSYLLVTLGTSDEQVAAQALYRKHGYVEVGERWLTPNLREIEFAKELR